MLFVYDLNYLKYGVRPQWGTISSDLDPRFQIGYERDKLRNFTISNLVSRYIQLTTDFSVFKPGGDFYELLEKNNIFYSFE